MIEVSRDRVRQLLGVAGKLPWYRKQVWWFILAALLILFAWCYPSKSPLRTPQTSGLHINATVLSDNLRWLSQQRGAKEGRLLLNKKQLRHNILSVHDVHPALPESVMPVALPPSRLQAPMEVFARGKEAQATEVSAQHPVLVRDHSGSFLIAGEVIQATLESAVSTDLAGPVRALVSRPVYAYTGKQVLIPVGSRLLGEYQQVMHEQQQRIWIRWNRVVLPTGDSVWLDAPSTDGMGQTGALADRVDRHAWMRFREAGLLSLLSGGMLLADGVNASTETAGQAFRSNVAGQMSEAAQQSWASHASLRPTAMLHPGHRIMIYVMHDVDCRSLIQGGRHGT